MSNRLTPHLLKGLAGLSEGLLDSYGDSWGFADERVLIKFQNLLIYYKNVYKLNSYFQEIDL